MRKRERILSHVEALISPGKFKYRTCIRETHITNLNSPERREQSRRGKRLCAAAAVAAAIAAPLHLYFHKCMQPSINGDGLGNEFYASYQSDYHRRRQWLSRGGSSVLIRFPTFRSVVRFLLRGVPGCKCISHRAKFNNNAPPLPAAFSPAATHTRRPFRSLPLDCFCKTSRGEIAARIWMRAPFSRGAVFVFNTGLHVPLRGKRHFRATGNLPFRFRISRLIATGFMVMGKFEPLSRKHTARHV